MKKLLILLSLFISGFVYSQTTEMHNLKMAGLYHDVEPGVVRVEWSVEIPAGMSVEDLTRNGNEKFYIQYRRGESGSFPDWEGQDSFSVGAFYYGGGGDLRIRTTALTPAPLVNGDWQFRVAFAFGSTLYDIVDNGNIHDPWTSPAGITIENNYFVPVLYLPDSPYTEQYLTLRWSDDANMPQYHVQASSNNLFENVSGEVFVDLNLVRTDNGNFELPLFEFEPGFIYFRIRGWTTNDTFTDWSVTSVLLYQPGQEYYYYIPWIATNEDVDTILGIQAQDTSLETIEIQIGVQPEGFETLWYTAHVDATVAFNLNIEEFFPFNQEWLQGGVLNIKSNSPLFVNVSYDAWIYGLAPIYAPYNIVEGTSEKLAIANLRVDQYHKTVVVVGNHDLRDSYNSEMASVRWTLMYYDESGRYAQYTNTITVQPQKNVLIDLNNIYDLPNIWNGKMVLQNLNPSVPISVIYSVNNNVEDNVTVFSFLSANQVR